MTGQRDAAGRRVTASPPPVAWDAGREHRGASPDRGPRCTVRGCPWRWRAGSDRPCPWHIDEAEYDATARARLASLIAAPPGDGAPPGA